MSQSAKFQKAMAPQSKHSSTTISRDPGPKWNLGNPSQVARVEEWGPRGRDSVVYEKHQKKHSQDKAVLREGQRGGTGQEGGMGFVLFLRGGASVGTDRKAQTRPRNTVTSHRFE